MHHAFQIEDRTFNVELSRARRGYRLHLGERDIPVMLHTEDDGRQVLTVDGVSQSILMAVRGDDVFIHLDGASYQLRYQHPLNRLAAQSLGAAEDRVVAPMPGSVVKLHVANGDAVKQGQTLMVIESMKMETTLSAVRDGVVAEVHLTVGQTFDRDALLISLEPREARS